MNNFISYICIVVAFFTANVTTQNPLPPLVNPDSHAWNKWGDNHPDETHDHDHGQGHNGGHNGWGHGHHKWRKCKRHKRKNCWDHRCRRDCEPPPPKPVPEPGTLLMCGLGAGVIAWRRRKKASAN